MKTNIKTHFSSQQQESEDITEELRACFKHLLLNWKSELTGQMYEEISLLHDTVKGADPIDIANQESDIQQRAVRRDTDKWLLFEIYQALLRINLKTYGYCEVTGEAIDIKRLYAWPIARRSIFAEEGFQKR
jgi:DnaK suppressor protein